MTAVDITVITITDTTEGTIRSIKVRIECTNPASKEACATGRNAKI